MSRPAASVRLLLTTVAFVGTAAISGCSSGTLVTTVPGAEAPAAPGNATGTAPETEPVASDFTALSSYYPVAEGNTWTYEIEFPKPIGTVVETETMTDVSPDGDDVRVTIEREFDFPDGIGEDTTDSVDYIFYADGSLEVPYQTVPNGDGTSVTVKKGSMRWPTNAEFEAGTKKKGTIEATVTSAGSSFEQVIDFTLQGKGEKSVTVPFGTFDARKLSQKFTVSIPDLGVDGLRIDSSIWLVEGVGMVKTEVPGLFADEPVVTRLVSFTAGD